MLSNYEIILKTDASVALFPVGYYPNKEPLIRWPEYLDFADLNEIRLLVRPKSMTSFLASLFFVDALRERYGNRKIYSLILPLVPGSRQDRLNKEGDFLFTAKSVAKEINARNFDQVTVVDPHSSVTPALIDRCRVVKPVDFILSQYAENSNYYGFVISPDAGAEGRAGEIAKALQVELLHGSKKRDITTGKLSGFALQLNRFSHLMEKKHGLVVDDLCDGGGTFIGLAKCIRENDLTADLYTTHGLYTKGVIDLLANYNQLITTDSVVNLPPEVSTISICEKLLNEPWIGG